MFAELLSSRDILILHLYTKIQYTVFLSVHMNNKFIQKFRLYFGLEKLSMPYVHTVANNSYSF